MTRQVNLLLPLAEGTVVNLDLCNKYAVPFYNTTKELTLGADGKVTVTLTVNDEDTCWRVQELAHNGLFWVYDDEGTQEIDLTKKVFPLEGLPAYLESEDSTLGLNVDVLFCLIYENIPVVCEEEQRLLCRYNRWLESGNDEEMCRVDKILKERYING